MMFPVHFPKLYVNGRVGNLGRVSCVCCCRLPCFLCWSHWHARSRGSLAVFLVLVTLTRSHGFWWVPGLPIVLGLYPQAGPWGFVAAVCPTPDATFGGRGICPGPSGTWEPALLSCRRPVFSS